jgi:TrmH family RNA methyltransferase
LITSPDNPKLKQIRKLQTKRERARSGLFVAEGEDLVAAADAAGWEPELLLVPGDTDAPDTDRPAFDAPPPDRRALVVDPGLLRDASALGSGSRVVAVYRQRWSEPGGDLSVYLHHVSDPGNVGAIIRSAHAFADGPVILGPGCADPYSPKAVRASMGSIFARPPARAGFADLPGTKVAYVMGGPDPGLVERPAVLCIGGERFGLGEVADQADLQAGIPMRPDAPNSLNAAMAATVALYEQFRMARHG